MGMSAKRSRYLLAVLDQDKWAP